MAENGTLNYGVWYKNYGHTPALKLTINTSITATPLPLSVVLKSNVSPDQRKSVGILWPEQEADNSGPLIVPSTGQRARFEQDYREDIAAERAAIFLHGEVRYLDAFKAPRVTTFRFMYTGFMYTGPWGGKKPLRFCDEGNEAN
jgi:hypothetical protein